MNNSVFHKWKIIICCQEQCNTAPLSSEVTIKSLTHFVFKIFRGFKSTKQRNDYFQLSVVTMVLLLKLHLIVIVSGATEKPLRCNNMKLRGVRYRAKV